jgi:hypothetical protein
MRKTVISDATGKQQSTYGPHAVHEDDEVLLILIARKLKLQLPVSLSASFNTAP